MSRPLSQRGTLLHPAESASPLTQPRAIINKLTKGIQNVVLAVTGDSTGNDSYEWVYQTCLQLGKRFPKTKIQYRVWNDTNQNYDAASTVQAGTSAIITDNFNRADSSTTPGTATTGQVWTNESGTSGIAANKLVPITTGGPVASIDTGYPEITTFTIDVTLPTNGGPVRILPKFLDVGNHLLVEVGSTGAASYIALFKRVASTATQYVTNSTTALTQGGTYTVTVTYKAGVLTATVNGVTVTATLSAADQITFGPASKLAVTCNTADQTGVAFDNLSLTSEPQRLDVYNASTPGQNAAYTLARLSSQLPVAPDHLFINYGHNYTGATLRSAYYALTKAVLDKYPNTDLVCVMQNPRTPGQPTRTDGLQRNAEIATLAAQEGYGLVDVTQRFLNNPNYVTDYFDPGETLHPNATGHQAWSAEVMRVLNGAPSVQPIRTQARETRKFIPATSFVAIPSIAAPTLTLVNSAALGQAFDQTTPQSLGALIDFPSTWQSVNTYILWGVSVSSGLTGGNAGCLWELGTAPINDITGVSDSSTVPVLSLTQAVGSAHNIPAYTTLSTLMRSQSAFANRPLYIQVKRAADQGSDTLATTAYFYGVIIERAS